MEKEDLSQAFEQHPELNSVIKKLTEKFDPIKIICFSKMESKVRSKGFFKDFKEVSISHYHLLMITEDSARIEHAVQDFVNFHFTDGTITILVHGIGIVQELTGKHHPFFCSVLGKGQLLYSKDGLFVASSIPQSDPKKTYEKALEHYNCRYSTAKAFHSSAKNALEEENYNIALFLMHQAVEQACIAMISVHLFYKSNIHNIDRLLKLTLCFSDKPSLVFRRNTKEDLRLFGILQSCYSMARYEDNYKVEINDAYKLILLVDDFLKVGEGLCNEHLKKLKAGFTLPIETIPILEMSVT